MTAPRIEPAEVVDLVGWFVAKEVRDASEYDNRSLLDESGVVALHELAAKIYALGWRDGEQAEFRREQFRRTADRQERDRLAERSRAGDGDEGHE